MGSTNGDFRMATKVKSRASRSLAGKPISDAKIPIDIYVSKKDGAKGKKRNPMSCAIARSMLNKEHVVSVRIGAKIALVEYKDRVIRYGLDNDDSDKIRLFDRTKYFKPGRVHLIPPKTKLGVDTVKHQKKKNAHSGPSGGVKRRPALRHVWRVQE